jgi:hypothetical protein
MPTRETNLRRAEAERLVDGPPATLAFSQLATSVKPGTRPSWQGRRGRLIRTLSTFHDVSHTLK